MTQRPNREPLVIDSRPNWLKNVQMPGMPLGEITVDGKPYQYTIVITGLEQRLPYTVGFPNESALFISTDVPQERRQLIMAHEVREKTRFAQLPEEERCLASLKAELEDAKRTLGDQYSDYLTDRITFFTSLVSLYEQPEQRSAVSNEFIKGINASSMYLHELRPA